MDPIEKIAAPTIALHFQFVLFVVLQELLLLIRVRLEEEATDLMKGATQPMQELAHAAFGGPSTEGLLDPVAHLRRRLEAAGGDLALEVVELGRLQSAPVAFVLQGAEGLQSAALVQFQPVVDRAGTDAEELGDLIERQSLPQPEQGRETVGDAHVFLLAT